MNITIIGRGNIETQFAVHCTCNKPYQLNDFYLKQGTGYEGYNA